MSFSGKKEQNDFKKNIECMIRNKVVFPGLQIKNPNKLEKNDSIDKTNSIIQSPAYKEDLDNINENFKIENLNEIKNGNRSDSEMNKLKNNNNSLINDENSVLVENHNLEKKGKFLKKINNNEVLKKSQDINNIDNNATTSNNNQPNLIKRMNLLELNQSNKNTEKYKMYIAGRKIDDKLKMPYTTDETFRNDDLVFQKTDGENTQLETNIFITDTNETKSKEDLIYKSTDEDVQNLTSNSNKSNYSNSKHTDINILNIPSISIPLSNIDNMILKNSENNDHNLEGISDISNFITSINKNSNTEEDSKIINNFNLKTNILHTIENELNMTTPLIPYSSTINISEFSNSQAREISTSKIPSPRIPITSQNFFNSYALGISTRIIPLAPSDISKISNSQSYDTITNIIPSPPINFSNLQSQINILNTHEQCQSKIPSPPIGLPKIINVPSVPYSINVPVVPKVPNVPNPNLQNNFTKQNNESICNNNVNISYGIPSIPNSKITAIPAVPKIINPQVPNITTTGLSNILTPNNQPPPLIPLVNMMNLNNKGPLLKAKQKVRTVQSLKPLYWIVIDQKKLSDTIWLKLDDAQFSINAIKFEDEFSLKKKDITTDKKDTIKQKPLTLSKPSVLLPSRQMNISIVLSKLKLTPIAIVEALISYDLKILNSQTCELILSISPNAAEINQVDAFEGDPMTLADSDQFVLLMKTAPGYDLRLKSILFQKTFKQERDELMIRINNFFSAFEVLIKNKNFHRWLELILAFGNYLNGSSNRGGAYAFRLDILSKISELKSNDNKKNLMYFMIEYIGEVLKEDELLRIPKDLEIFSRLSYSTISDLFKEFNTKFKNLNSLLEILQKECDNIEDDDKSAEFLDTFYPDVQDSVKLIEDNIKKIDGDYISLIKLFGDTPKDMPMETLLDIINKFSKDVTSNVVIYMKGREIKEKMERRKAIIEIK